MTTVARDIVEYLYESYVNQIEFTLEKFLAKKCGIRAVTIARLLDRKEISFPTRTNLADGFTAQPGCGTVLQEWFNASSVAEFKRLHETYKTSVTKLEIEIPRSGNLALLEKIAGFYVTYRYAFDAADGGTEVSREFLALEVDGDRLKFEMHYRVTGEDEKTAPLVYRGFACVAGGSVMALAVSTAQRADHEDVSRGRYLTFAHTLEKKTPQNDRDLKFGILTSTRIEAHEPCTACIVMFRVNSDIQDMEEFRKKIAVVRQWETFKTSDFGQFPVTEDFNIQADMEILMKNVPRNDHNDKVLRLHFDRFKSIRSRILFAAKNIKGLRAPWARGGIMELTAQSRMKKKKTPQDESGGGTPPALAAE